LKFKDFVGVSRSEIEVDFQCLCMKMLSRRSAMLRSEARQIWGETLYAVSSTNIFSG
jgi:hypothetical protein